jgi:hypothetical protein
MTAIDLEQLESAMQALVGSLEREMPTLYLSNTRELVHVREWRVALENLCELIYEETGGHCPQSIRDQISTAQQRLAPSDSPRARR